MCLLAAMPGPISNGFASWPLPAHILGNKARMSDVLDDNVRRSLPSRVCRVVVVVVRRVALVVVVLALQAVVLALVLEVLVVLALLLEVLAPLLEVMALPLDVLVVLPLASVLGSAPPNRAPKGRRKP